MTTPDEITPQVAVDPAPGRATLERMVAAARQQLDVRRIVAPGSQVRVLETPADFRWADAAPGKWFRVNGEIGLAAISAGEKLLLLVDGCMKPSTKAPVERIDPESLLPDGVKVLVRQEKCLRSHAEADAVYGKQGRAKYPSRRALPDYL